MNTTIQVLLITIVMFAIGIAYIAYPIDKPEMYVIKNNEVVLFKDTRTNHITVHTFGDTLEVEKYHKVIEFGLVFPKRDSLHTN